jgi:hypothetical protein
MPIELIDGPRGKVRFLELLDRSVAGLLCQFVARRREFVERELKEQRPASAEIASIPLRLIL